MLRANLFVFAEHALFDQESNNLSVVNVLERIGASGFPTLIQRAVLACQWYRDPGAVEPEQLHLRIVLSVDGADDVVVTEHRMDVATMRARLRVHVNGMVLQRPGIYVFRLEHRVNDEWVEMSRHPLEVWQDVPAEPRPVGA